MKNMKEVIAYLFVAVGVILFCIGIVLATATGSDASSIVNTFFAGGLGIGLAIWPRKNEFEPSSL